MHKGVNLVKDCCLYTEIVFDSKGNNFFISLCNSSAWAPGTRGQVYHGINTKMALSQQKERLKTAVRQSGHLWLPQTLYAIHNLTDLYYLQSRDLRGHARNFMFHTFSLCIKFQNLIQQTNRFRHSGNFHLLYTVSGATGFETACLLHF